jgi:hypothetical protein
VLVDGARHQLDLIKAQAARRGITVHIVIDFVHVLERLWTAAWSVHAPADPAAEDRVATWALALLAGQVHQVITDLKHHAGTLPDDRRGGIDTTIGYLANNTDHLRYDHALAHGWPIATGVIEGACRHLIADRFNLAGARWGLAGAEAMLKLRALSTNQDLDRYWAYHLRREHERTHDQHEYALTA